MCEIPETLLLKISSSPETPVNLIVRVDGDLDAGEDRLVSLGVEIRGKFRLINGFAVCAPGSVVRDLASQPWVTFIEEDQQIQVT